MFYSGSRTLRKVTLRPRSQSKNHCIEYFIFVQLVRGQTFRVLPVVSNSVLHCFLRSFGLSSLMSASQYPVAEATSSSASQFYASPEVWYRRGEVGGALP